MFSTDEPLSKYDYIHELLDRFNFNIPASRDIICTICHALLRDAYRNICGCKYCSKCIFQYVDMDDKHCPGDSALCKIIIKRANITSDPATNRKIALITVHCPMRGCQYQGPLKNIDRHMRTSQCSFQMVDNKISTEDLARVSSLAEKIEKIESQIDNIPISHADIENLRNSYELQNAELSELKSEIGWLKLRICSLQMSKEKQTAPGVQEMHLLRSDIENLKATNELMEGEWKVLIKNCVPSGNSRLHNKVMKFIKVLKFEVNQRKKDKICLEKLCAEIETIKKNTERSICQYDVCHDNYKSLEKRFKAAENLMQYRSTDHISDLGVLQRQVKELQNQMMNFGDCADLKLLRTELEERLDRTRLDLKGYYQRQEQLTNKIEQFMQEAQASSADLASSKLRLEAQVAELYRHTDKLLVGKVRWALEKPVEWVVEDFPYKLQRAIDGEDPYTMSEWFDFIDYRVGFKMYPFGTDEFAGSHMSLLMYIVKKTARDTGPLSKWVTISVVDQMDGSSSVSRRFLYSSLVKQESVDCGGGMATEAEPMLGALDFFPLKTFQTSERFIKNKSLLIRASAQTWENCMIDKDCF